MNKTLTIRVDEGLKKNFIKNSKNNGLDVSFLLRYFMKRYNDNPSIVRIQFDDNFDKIFQDDTIKASMKKLSNKLDSLGF